MMELQNSKSIYAFVTAAFQWRHTGIKMNNFAGNLTVCLKV